MVDTGNCLDYRPEAETAFFTGYCMVEFRLSVYLPVCRAGDLGRNRRVAVIIDEGLHRGMVLDPEIFLDTDLVPEGVIDCEIGRYKVLHEELLYDRIVLRVDVEPNLREEMGQFAPHSELIFILNFSRLIDTDDLYLSLCKLVSQIILYLGEPVPNSVGVDCVSGYHTWLEVAMPNIAGMLAARAAPSAGALHAEHSEIVDVVSHEGRPGGHGVSQLPVGSDCQLVRLWVGKTLVEDFCKSWSRFHSI